LLNASIDGHEDNRNRCRLQAKFMLDGSLLIRSGFGEQDQGPDTIHLHSYRADTDARSPVLSGTSLAGVLRHRAERILHTLSAAPTKSNRFLDEMFGPAKIESAKRSNGANSARASRLLVRETVIQNAQELVQNRIRIDRFTGGAYESALFNEQPLFGDDKTYVSIDLSLRDPKPSDIGLLLLLLKDLWTGDLPLGGESSIGRGRLQGVEASITLNGEVLGHLQAGTGGQVTIEGDRGVLEDQVANLRKELSK
jgi:CRISPR/Cas system CSM-associated protein Csm3 (group 7 of RAMP superfamily)